MCRTLSGSNGIYEKDSLRKFKHFPNYDGHTSTNSNTYDGHTFKKFNNYDGN